MCIAKNKKLTEKFYQFFEDHDPTKVGRHLRNILLDYMRYSSGTGTPIDFHDYVWEIQELLELLDLAADQKKTPDNEVFHAVG